MASENLMFTMHERLQPEELERFRNLSKKNSTFHNVDSSNEENIMEENIALEPPVEKRRKQCCCNFFKNNIFKNMACKYTLSPVVYYLP